LPPDECSLAGALADSVVPPADGYSAQVAALDDYFPDDFPAAAGLGDSAALPAGDSVPPERPDFELELERVERAHGSPAGWREAVLGGQHSADPADSLDVPW
jgi:hypothetical protein